MERNWESWSVRLLVVLCTLLALAYFWRKLDHDGAATQSVDKEMAGGAGASRTQPTSLAPAVTFHAKITADGTTAVPVQFQLPNVTRVRTARSYQEWLTQFPSLEQEKIELFNKAHFGLYRVNSREQVAWMAANGYPMPEDIVAAERLN